MNDKSYYVLARDKAAEVMDEKYGYDLEDDFSDLWKQSNKLKSKEFIFTFYGSVAEDGVAGSHMDLATRYFGNGEGGWGDYFSETRFFDAFPEGPRKDATFTSVFADGTTFTEAGVEPFIAKYSDGGRRVNTSSEGFRPILRFADVLLIYAEAANYVNNGPDQGRWMHSTGYIAGDGVKVPHIHSGHPKMNLTGLSWRKEHGSLLAKGTGGMTLSGERW